LFEVREHSNLVPYLRCVRLTLVGDKNEVVVERNSTSQSIPSFKGPPTDVCLTPASGHSRSQPYSSSNTPYCVISAGFATVGRFGFATMESAQQPVCLPIHCPTAEFVAARHAAKVTTVNRKMSPAD